MKERGRTSRVGRNADHVCAVQPETSSVYALTSSHSFWLAVKVHRQLREKVGAGARRRRVCVWRRSIAGQCARKLLPAPPSAMDHDEDRSLSLGTEVSASVPPPSPLTGCYLLAVIGEPHTHEHKEIILQRLVKGQITAHEHQALVE
ncbi:hypothetical protein KGM_205603 [Danaus plexippus plexippus]|uniref:Uncharacterized protein n=1 Tax=Danaus plexippus plexippus TaxID=278856 RepID=A0A212EMH2_DANPL|nr:hypothetical protein KGM_205603 [Danaus plexippus plexippus]